MRRRDQGYLPMEVWPSFAEAFGGKVTPSSLVAAVGRYGWMSAVEALATAAADGAVDSDRAAERLLEHLNKFFSTEGREDRARLRDYVNGPGRGRPILHERATQFLQQMMILHGGSDEVCREPRIDELAVMGLMANDYLSRVAPTPTLDTLHVLFADSCHYAIFNQSAERNLFVRLVHLFGAAQPRLRNRRAWDQIAWPDFTRRALGASFAEHYYELILPLLLWSMAVWGHETEDGRLHPPIFEIAEWASEARMSRVALEGFLRTAHVDRDEARRRLAPFLNADGLPRANSLFFETPFIRTRGERFAAASPGAYWQYLRRSLWEKYHAAAQDVFGGGGGAIWRRTFGDFFEDWIRYVAGLADAAPSRHRGTRIIMTKEPSKHDEIEDVLLVSGDKVALISVKTAMIRSELPREGFDPLGIVRRWEKFLFQRGIGRAGGALRQLDAKFRNLRKGQYEPLLSRRLTVYPVLVMYEDLGDNPAAARWIARGCQNQALLRGAGVKPVVPATVDDFELLMAVIAGGGDAFDVLDETNDHNDPRLRSAVYRYCLRHQLPTFQALNEEADQVVEIMRQRLFGGIVST